MSVQRDNPVHHPLTHIQSFTHPFSPSRRPTGINANVETGSDKENGVVSRPKAPLEPVVRHLWSPIGKLQRHCGGKTDRGLRSVHRNRPFIVHHQHNILL